ncbi:MAG: hypothetical protein AB7L76_10550 [Burkholderiaceae bacterium]
MTSRSVRGSLAALAACGLPFAAVAQGTPPPGFLENPVEGSVESGIGLVSGWHCTAKQIRVTIDGTDLGTSGVGSIRNDTAAICGHPNTGFSLLYNYNKLSPGLHTISVYADGALLETRQFYAVRSGGVPYLEGANREVEVADFPQAGTSTTLRWSQAKQSFVVVGSELDDLTPVANSLHGRTFFGNIFYPGGSSAMDATDFSFEVASGSFALVREAHTQGTCVFRGDYSLSTAGVSSTGTYTCSDGGEGTYRATNLHVNELGVYSGSIVRTPQGSGTSLTEVHAGHTLVFGSPPN